VTPSSSDADHLHGTDIDTHRASTGRSMPSGATASSSTTPATADRSRPRSVTIGINSAVVEKASTLLYRHGGQGLDHMGAD